MRPATCMTTGFLALTFMGASTGSALDIGASGFASHYDADAAGDAWGGGALVRFGIFDWLAADGRVSRLDFDDADLEVTPVEAAGLARLALFNNTLVPYGGMGVGYYLFDDSSQAQVDNAYGMFPMLGLDFRFGSEKRWSAFAEARWLFLSEDLEVPGVPSSDDLDGVAVNAGVGFQF